MIFLGWNILLQTRIFCTILQTGIFCNMLHTRLFCTIFQTRIFLLFSRREYFAPFSRLTTFQTGTGEISWNWRWKPAAGSESTLHRSEMSWEREREMSLVSAEKNYFDKSSSVQLCLTSSNDNSDLFHFIPFFVFTDIHRQLESGWVLCPGST